MKRPTGDVDWFSLAAFVAKHAPGAGDPMAMPVDQLLAMAHAIGEGLTREAEAQLAASRRMR